MDQKSLTGNNEPESVIERAREVLVNYDGEDRVVSSMEFAAEVRARAKPAVSLTSGLGQLDKAIDGFQPGELIVVSGPTAMGKTLLCDTIMRHMRREKHFSLFFTFEVTAESVALQHDSPDSVIFLPRQHQTKDLNWIWMKTLEAKVKYNCESVFIDHLHYLLDMGGQQNMSMEIGRIMRALKRMALETEMAVFIVCHVKQLDMETEPSIYHLRDSSFVGQEADTVLMVWRRWDLDDMGRKMDTRLQGLSTVKVLKSRRAGTMDAKIKIKKAGHLLVESLDEPEPAKRERRKAFPPLQEPAPEDWRTR